MSSSAELGKMKLQIADHITKVISQKTKIDPDNPQIVQAVWEQVKKAVQQSPVAPPDANQFVNEIVDEIIGFGPIQQLLNDDDITEVMVNGPKQIYIEKKGKLTVAPATFNDDDHVERIINKIVEPLGRKADAETPLVDARLPDGSRVNAVVRPCAIDGPSITIRKFSKEKFTVNDLINFGSLTKNMAGFLQACVGSKLNILVSGGTGSGKTTLLNVLSNFISDEDRIVTIEDAAELSLSQSHVVRLETKHAVRPGDTHVSIRDLVKNSLRMRPERIIIGECRGGEALDMLQAMNTGHDGSLTTVHANSPRDAISRLETLVLMAGMDLPIQVVRKQIASAVNMIVQQARLRDGSRKVIQITELTGMEGENIVLQDIFKYDDQGDDGDGKVIGEFEPTGLRPHCEPTLRIHGYNLPATVFMRERKLPGGGARRR